MKKDKVPATKTCSCGINYPVNSLVTELVGKKGKIKGQFWFNCTCGSTMVIITEEE